MVIWSREAGQRSQKRSRSLIDLSLVSLTFMVFLSHFEAFSFGLIPKYSDLYGILM